MPLNDKDATVISPISYGILPVEENLKLEPKYFRIAGKWVCKWVVVPAQRHEPHTTN